MIGNGKRIVYDDKSLAPLAAILANDIRMATAVLMSAAQGKAATHEIALSLDNKLAKESYVLTVTDRGILVVGQNYNAVAMGTATLLQSMSRNEKGEIVVPAYVVKDWCFAEFNSLMLDIAREDHSLEALRDVIDLCRKLDSLLLAKPVPTAFLVAVPNHVPATIGHLTRRGFPVPSAAAVISRMDARLLMESIPSIARYQVDPERLGRGLARLLLKALNPTIKTTIGQCIIMPEFVDGETAGRRAVP